MMRLRRIWNDLKAGDNIDLYLSVSVALLLTGLNLVGAAPQDWLAPITLTVLALLAISGLGNRHKMDEILAYLNRSKDTVLFQEQFPPTLADCFRTSHEILLIGHSLAHTLSDNYSILEERLRQGCMIRILVVDPEGLACKLGVSRIYRPMIESMYRDIIRAALHDVCTLKKIAPSQLEVRVIDQIFAFGIRAFDISSDAGSLYLEHYPVQMAGDLPKMVLSAKDGHWYQFFKEQAQLLWAAGKKWDCPSD